MIESISIAVSKIVLVVKVYTVRLTEKFVILAMMVIITQLIQLNVKNVHPIVQLAHHWTNVRFAIQVIS